MSKDPLVGRTFGGKYVIESCLGQGGFGAVYRARQLTVGRAVAVKVVRPGPGDPLARERFLREATALARLQSRAVAMLHDFGEDADGLLYLVQEFADGRNLQEVLRNEGTLPPLRVVDLGVAVLEALVEAHTLGIVHRDVKPANIMLVPTRKGTEVVKLVDFGLAKAPMQGGTLASITADDHIPGTPAYMAPEVWNQQALTGAVDQYALGVVLYRALAGRHPFEHPTLPGLMQQHLYDPPPRLVGVPAPLEAVLLRALAKRPQDRFPSAVAMREALFEALPDETVPLDPSDRADLLALLEPTERSVPQVRGDGPTPVDAQVPFEGMEPTPAVQVVRRTRSPLVAATIVLAALVGAAVALWTWEPEPTPEPPRAPVLPWADAGPSDGR